MAGNKILLSTRCVITSVINTRNTFPAAAAVANVMEYTDQHSRKNADIGNDVKESGNQTQ
jgi:hypothetical protein